MPRAFDEKNGVEKELYVINQCNKHLSRLSAKGRLRAVGYLDAEAVEAADPRQLEIPNAQSAE